MLHLTTVSSKLSISLKIRMKEGACILPDACHLKVHIPIFQNLTNLRTNLRCLNVKLYLDKRLLTTHNSSFILLLCEFSNRIFYVYSKLLKWLIPMHAIIA